MLITVEKVKFEFKKENMKRFLYCLILLCFNTTQSQIKTEFNIDSFEYIIEEPYSTDNYEVRIKKYNNCPSGILTIPKTIYYNSKTYIIIGVANNAFENCSNLTNVIFPDSIIELGNNSFRNTGLTNITLPNSLINIGYGTFSSCKTLKDIILPNSIKSIGSNTFSGCTSLENISISTSLTNLTYNTFSGCKSLKNIIIPSNIKNIESSCFSECISLESITIPSKVESIGDYAFYNCTSLKTVIVNLKIPLSINTTVFKNVTINNIPLIVPKNTETLYNNTIIWEDFGSISTLKIKDFENNIKVQLFPNPTEKHFKIILNNNFKLEKIVIYNTLGQFIKSSKKLIIDTSNLKLGIYYIQIETNKGKATKKIIIK